MKKALSPVLSLVLIVSVISTQIVSFAADKKYVEDVLAQIQTTKGFIPNETAAVTGNCYGFISKVCDKLFGVSYKEGLNSNGYTCKHNTGKFYTVIFIYSWFSISRLA